MKKRIAEWYIRNKAKIMSAIFFIILIIIISIIINLLALRERTNTETENKTNTQVDINLFANVTQIYIDNQESIITGEEISSSQVTMLGVIEQFVELCNDKKINEAYDILSETCKQEVYPTLESFEVNYYNKIFNGNKKKISAENWNSNIYIVTYADDALSTGIYSEENNIQDYISVINENNEPKLNINNYIGRQEINKATSNNVITINVLRSDTYMDYEVYTYKITNNTNNTILLDDLNNNGNMYIQDKNGNQYNSYLHELSEEQLTITPGETKEISIKYYSKYGSTKEIDKIVFSNIITNYNQNEVRQVINLQIEL